MTTGVYQIFCTETGERYIGGTQNIERRFRGHRSELRSGKHYNKRLQQAWDKYGSGAFKFCLIEKCEVGQEKVREQVYLDNCDSLFNIYKDANGPRGCVRSEETRARMSAAHKNPSLETRAKISAAGKRRRHSEETRSRMSTAHKNRSDEHRAKLSAAAKAQWAREKGKKLSDETRAKMSAAHTGKKLSDETRARMSAAAKARHAREKAAKAEKAAKQT